MLSPTRLNRRLVRTRGSLRNIWYLMIRICPIGYMTTRVNALLRTLKLTTIHITRTKNSEECQRGRMTQDVGRTHRRRRLGRIPCSDLLRFSKVRLCRMPGVVEDEGLLEGRGRRMGSNPK